MSGVIAWMTAEAEQPQEVNTPPFENREGWGSQPSDIENPHFSQNRGEVGHPQPLENLPAHQFPQPAECSDVEQERRIYRGRTVAMLRRYMRYSIETGRLPSLLGREFFRTGSFSCTTWRCAWNGWMNFHGRSSRATFCRSTTRQLPADCCTVRREPCEPTFPWRLTCSVTFCWKRDCWSESHR
jgi:hypothetical protein